MSRDAGGAMAGAGWPSMRSWPLGSQLAQGARPGIGAWPRVGTGPGVGTGPRGRTRPGAGITLATAGGLVKPARKNAGAGRKFGGGGDGNPDRTCVSPCELRGGFEPRRCACAARCNANFPHARCADVARGIGNGRRRSSAAAFSRHAGARLGRRRPDGKNPNTVLPAGPRQRRVRQNLSDRETAHATPAFSRVCERNCRDRRDGLRSEGAGRDLA